MTGVVRPGTLVCLRGAGYRGCHAKTRYSTGSAMGHQMEWDTLQREYTDSSSVLGSTQTADMYKQYA